MRLPISPAGAAAGLMVWLAYSALGVAAGVVPPPPPQQPPLSNPQLHMNASTWAAAPQATTGVLPALPTATNSVAGEPQPFWFPGADESAIANVSLSSVPVRSADPEAAGAILLGTQQHPLIPLPASAWTGMAGLLGLGAVKLIRNARRLLA